MATMAPAPYYDPYDFEIDADPYPVWRRLRDEAPLYYNEKYDFYALSRFDDVEHGAGRLADIQLREGLGARDHPGEHRDPAGHDPLRGPARPRCAPRDAVRVFTPRRMAAIEPQVREFCAATLDPLVGTGGFDFVRDLGAQMPMRTIGMLLGIPEEDQQALRDRIHEGLPSTEDDPMPDARRQRRDADRVGFAAYIDWRAEHPSDDLMTELLNAEFEDETGTGAHASPATRSSATSACWRAPATRRPRG